MIGSVAPPVLACADAVAALVIACFDDNDAAWSHVLQCALQEAERIIKVLDDVPKRDDVIEVVGGQVCHEAAPQALAAMLRSAGVDSPGVPSVGIRLFNELSVTCADIEQPAPKGAERGDELQSQLGDLSAHVRIIIRMILGLTIPMRRMIDALRHGADQRPLPCKLTVQAFDDGDLLLPAGVGRPDSVCADTRLVTVWAS